MICVDEFGPLNLQPRPGYGWFPRREPARQQATYTRTAGVRQMFAALDLASGQLFYRFRDRKRWQEFLDFCKQLRRRFPTGRLCEFIALRYCTLDGSDYPSHVAQEQAIAHYIRWSNRYATPKRQFATNSKIRRPDYLPNVA